MLTRRTFLCTLAAVAASRVAPVPVAARDRWGLTTVDVLRWRAACAKAEADACRAVMARRRDDGDTILELR